MQKPGRKAILSAPLATFKSFNPRATEQELSALSDLWNDYSARKMHHEALQNQTRAISRQIGAAKRHGKPTEDLMASMREHTGGIRSDAAGISELESRILAFFDAGSSSAACEAQPTAVPSGRTYALSAGNVSELRISLLDQEQDEWNDYVAKNPAASLYHRAEWKALIQETFGHESFYFLARKSDGRIAGVLPLVRLRSYLFGDFLVSMPYFNYGGAVGDQEAVEARLMQAANTHATELGVSHIEYRDDIPRSGLPGRSNKVNMLLALPEDEESLWAGFSSKLRAQIRRPQRENLETRCGGEEYLDDFYRVFSRNMRDLGTPVYAKAFFRNILQCFPSNSRVLVVRMKSIPVAAGFLMGHRDTLEIPWASSLREANPLGVNMLLYWKVLQYAVAGHYRLFDFGRSSVGSGTYRFKRQWGAEPKQLYWHYHLNTRRELPSLNPENPKFTLAVNIWKRMPLFLTNTLGPLIVRSLP